MKKWLGAVIGLDEKHYALYYCPNQACTQFQVLVCKNVETDEPFKGDFSADNCQMLETAYV